MQKKQINSGRYRQSKHKENRQILIDIDRLDKEKVEDLGIDSKQLTKQ